MPKLRLTPEETEEQAHFTQASSTRAIHPVLRHDVSAKTLAVALHQQDRPVQQRDFANTAAGHKQLIAWLLKSGTSVRVSLEATGIDSLDLALALDAAQGIEVAVLNPKIVNRFAQTLRRSKTDQADAIALAEYTLRMPFLPWCRPAPIALQLRAISRQMAALTKQHTAESNRLHAATGSLSTPRCVRQDIKRSIDALQKRSARLRREALDLIQQNPQMARNFRQRIGIKGIAETSALQRLGELASLDPDLTVRQWVALSGLDPAHRQSGTSSNKPSRISRHGNSHLRLALFMPALVATRHDPYFRAFYQALQPRHKTKLQALMAVARKLLHAIDGIFKTGTEYDGAKLFPQQKLA